MKIHASYFILWALGYIYTSAEGVTTAHVDNWNMNSSWLQNCLSFCFSLSQVLHSPPIPIISGRISTGNVQWIYFLHPIWECLFQLLQTLELSSQNLGTVMCCDIAVLSLFLMVLLLEPLVWHCWFCPIMPGVLPRKSCNSPKGKWATLRGGYHSAPLLAQPDFWERWLTKVWVVVPKTSLFYKGFAACLQWHSCNNTLSSGGGAVVWKYILNPVHLRYEKAKPVTQKIKCFFTRLEMV